MVPDGPSDDNSGDMFSLRDRPPNWARIAFGNDPEDATNGSIADPPGGAGRVYFTDPDGHLYELVVVPTAR